MAHTSATLTDSLTIATWSLVDYHRMIEAGILQGRSVELINGEIVEMAPEGEFHAASSVDAGEYLAQLLGTRAQVRPAKPITLPNSASEPEPDLAIVERRGRKYRQHHPYPKNIFWVIEYSDSSLRKDLDVKTKVYAEAGIEEYWVVNLQNQTVILFRNPLNGVYQSKQTVQKGKVSPLAFSDIVVDVSLLL
ncbi:MAG: Uma2 family endonuclease [Cyanobacteria bacterium P01_F01_bin.150]